MAHETKLVLPPSIVGAVDVGKLARELASLNESMLQLKLRHSGSDVKLPKTTELMDRMVTHNKLNLLHETDRNKLLHFLTTTKDQAPVIHMSFSADPSPAFLEKLMSWLRREIHPELLLTIGLQPNIGVGCIMRTTNHYFDFSLKQTFGAKRELLHKRLVEVPAAAPANQPAGG